MRRVGRLLVVHRPGRIPLPDPFRTFHEILAVARFVAHRPHDDAGVVLVALHHVPDPIKMGLEPRGILRQRLLLVAHAVGLDVRFVDDIEAELVAELQERRVVGVVRRADGIDVRTLHLQQVRADVRGGDVVAVARVVIVAVHSFKKDGPAVVEELPVLHLITAESGLSRMMGDFLTGGVGE